MNQEYLIKLIKLINTSKDFINLILHLDGDVYVSVGELEAYDDDMGCYDVYFKNLSGCQKIIKLWSNDINSFQDIILSKEFQEMKNFI